MNPLRAILHAHTNRCDGRNTLDEMVEEAIRQEYLTLGISSHSTLSFDNNFAMTAQAERAYLEEMEVKKEQVAEEIEILIGLEWDLDTPRGFVPFSRYDYMIGSVHQLYAKGIHWAVDDTEEEFAAMIREGFDGDWEEAVKRYYDAVVECVLRPEVDIVGHFDLLRKRNFGDRYFPEGDPAYKRIAESALQRILSARPDLVFEVNFGGQVRAGLKTPYPDREWMKWLRRNGARITIQADAHQTDGLTDGWEEAIQYAKEAGFTSVYRMRKDRIWEKVQI